jgi:biotin operon repressor
MPITASLGALTYSRILKANDSWYLQFTSNQTLVDIELNSNRLYVMLEENITLDQYFSVISMLMPYNPAIIWQTNFYSPNFPNASSTATQTSTLNDLINVGNNTLFPIGSPVRFSGTVFGGVSAGVTYYIHSYTATAFLSISTTPTGSKLNLTDASGSMTISRWFGSQTPQDYIDSPQRLRYNTYNDRLYALTSIRTFVDSYVDEVGFPALINSFDKTTGNLQTSYIDLSTETSRDFRRTPLDITFIDANNYVTTNTYNTNLPSFFRGQISLSKIQNNTTQIFQNDLGASTVNGILSGPGYVTLNSTGDIISVNNEQTFIILPGGSLAATFNTYITKSNPTTGSVIWQRVFSIPNTYPSSTPPPQNFTDAVIDSSDNLYLVFQETRRFDPTNTLGGFIVKLDNSNNIVWQKHIDEIQLKGIDIDSSGNLYVVGSKDGGVTPPPQVGLPDSTIISKIDSTGNLIWSNELNAFGPGNIGNVVSNFIGSRIEVDNDDHLVVAGNITITGVGGYGYITRLPSDGSIPSSGSYAIDIPSNPYTLTYQTYSPTVNTYTFNTSTSNTTGNSVTSTLSSFTPGPITTDKSTTEITILV